METSSDDLSDYDDSTGDKGKGQWTQDKGKLHLKSASEDLFGSQADSDRNEAKARSQQGRGGNSYVEKDDLLDIDEDALEDTIRKTREAELCKCLTHALQNFRLEEVAKALAAGLKED